MQSGMSFIEDGYVKWLFSKLHITEKSNFSFFLSKWYIGTLFKLIEIKE